ncbi:MAG: MarR family transcriptional regulator [Dehalococcoidia bacterium]|nr:MarR family transcriptional regulator [Dehalococcoidia bacterium]
MITLPATDNDTLSHAAQVLEALPVLRRWLIRSGPPKGSRPAGGGLSLSQVRVLVHIFHSGAQTMSELAYGLGISCSTATESVSALESRGRVVRNRSTSDRRQVVVSLTPEAEAIAAEVYSHRKEVVERTIRQLSVQERKAFVKGLSLLAENAESWVDQTPRVERTTEPKRAVRV